MDATWRVLDLDRMNQVSWKLQRERLKNFAEKFDADLIIAEQNAMGDPLIENLREEIDLPVSGFVTTNTSKRHMIDALSIAIERNQVSYPRIPVLLDELQHYELRTTSSGLIQYGAFSTLHDDCVMSLGIALQGFQGHRHDSFVNEEEHTDKEFVLGGPRAMADNFLNPSA